MSPFFLQEDAWQIQTFFSTFKLRLAVLSSCKGQHNLTSLSLAGSNVMPMRSSSASA